MRSRTIVAACAGAFIASFLLARAHPFGDAAMYAKPRAGESGRSSIPPDVRAILYGKCADCHSAQTRPPVYGRFAPASWLMERDIVKAREAMNLSAWESYPADDQRAFKLKIVLETRFRKMPPPQYLAIHWGAGVNDAELATLIRWAHDDAVAGPVMDAQIRVPGDAGRGQAVFERRCTGCHALEQNREGPRLRGVFGRPAGSIADFGYSEALKNARIHWTEDALNRWLTNPDAMFPGTNMDFYVPKPQERADVIEFLKTQRPE